MNKTLTESRFSRWLVASLMLACLVSFAAPTASACPTCKAALENDESEGDVMAGYFWSILFMMSMPFALFGSFGGYMYLIVRKARAENETVGTVGRRARK